MRRLFSSLVTAVCVIAGIFYVVDKLSPVWSKVQAEADAPTLPDLPDLPAIPGVGTEPNSTEPNTTAAASVSAGQPCVSSALPAPDGGQIAAAQTALAALPRAKEHGDGYNRDLFAHWTDPDNDGFDGRQQALGQQSVTDASVDNSYRIVSGLWCDPYSTTDNLGVYVADPGALDIDHSVALKEAWDSGAWQWTPEQREALANDNADTFAAGGLQLIAVDAGENRSKGDKDPSQWMPHNPQVRCAYAVNWVQVKTRWGLSVDESEAGYLTKALATCAAGSTPKRPG